MRVDTQIHKQGVHNICIVKPDIAGMTYGGFHMVVGVGGLLPFSVHLHFAPCHSAVIVYIRIYETTSPDGALHSSEKTAVNDTVLLQ